MDELYLVRHGRTAWNAAGRFQGHSDVPLSADGMAEAQAAARALRCVPFAGIIASDLSRAAETAREIARGRDVLLESDARLREIAFGEWEGLTWAEISERFPDAASGNRYDPGGFLPEGGESFENVKLRVGSVLDDLERRAGVWCLVAHAGTIHAALAALFGAHSPSQGVRLDSASISRITFRDGRADVVTLNDVSHLATV